MMWTLSQQSFLLEHDKATPCYHSNVLGRMTTHIPTNDNRAEKS
jgi:hypothetical protein